MEEEKENSNMITHKTKGQVNYNYVNSFTIHKWLFVYLDSFGWTVLHISCVCAPIHVPYIQTAIKKISLSLYTCTWELLCDSERSCPFIDLSNPTQCHNHDVQRKWDPLLLQRYMYFNIGTLHNKLMVQQFNAEGDL